MNATVVVTKSFDHEERSYSKGWYNDDDFMEFFKDEGQYLDRLCGVLDENGKSGDDFTVTYVVHVTK